MNFNDCITGFITNCVPVIEDVIVTSSLDGTSHHVTLCGPYGVELSDETISDAELDCLKNELTEVCPGFEFIFD